MHLELTKRKNALNDWIALSYKAFGIIR